MAYYEIAPVECPLQ
ncbi:hypothetical protein EE612_050730 [Oryza sativa]|nr:hypothetical protein EE612_050730 [Oryza sativa]